MFDCLSCFIKTFHQEHLGKYELSSKVAEMAVKNPRVLLSTLDYQNTHSMRDQDPPPYAAFAELEFQLDPDAGGFTIAAGYGVDPPAPSSAATAPTATPDTEVPPAAKRRLEVAFSAALPSVSHQKATSDKACCNPHLHLTFNLHILSNFSSIPPNFSFITSYIRRKPPCIKVCIIFHRIVHFLPIPEPIALSLIVHMVIVRLIYTIFRQTK